MRTVSRFGGRVESERAATGEGAATQFRFEIIKALCINHISKESAIDVERGVTELVTERFGGKAVYVHPIFSTRERDSKIRQDCAEGATVKECAAKYHVSREQVRHVLRRQNSEADFAPELRPGGKFIEDVVFWIAEQIRHQGLKEATQIAMQVGKHLEVHFSGSLIYIPKWIAKALLHRDAELCADFKEGMTHQELAEKYGITSRQVYSVLKKERERRREAAKQRVTLGKSR